MLGAFVADAASLGFHWLYDPKRIAELTASTGTPEFRSPSEKDFEGVFGYFAHGARRNGDLTMYGEHLLTAVKAVAESDGDWNPFLFQSIFAQTFDRGGSYVGYIDGATNGTLDNLKKLQGESLARAFEAIGGQSSIPEEAQPYFAKYTEKLGVTKRGEALQTAMENLLTERFNNKELGAKARQFAKFYDEHRPTRSGVASDNQVSGFAKVPAVVVALAGRANLLEKVEEAVRLTNDNDECVAFGLYAAKVLEKVLLGSTVEDSLQAALQVPMEDEKLHVVEQVQKALQGSAMPPPSLAETFGMPCPMPNCVPLSVAILKQTPTYTAAVRTNILCGGDNAGRSIIIGSILGAAHGVGGASGIPLEWIGRTLHIDALTATVSRAVHGQGSKL